MSGRHSTSRAYGGQMRTNEGTVLPRRWANKKRLSATSKRFIEQKLVQFVRIANNPNAIDGATGVTPVGF